MTRISKVKISDKILLRTYELFFEIIAHSYKKDTFLLVMDDLLSPTEKIMVAKRIAIIYLLVKQVNQLTISDILKVSRSTVSVYALLIYKKKSKMIELIEQLLSKEKVKGMLEDLVVELLVQPGVKVGHHRMKQSHQIRKQNREILG